MAVPNTTTFSLLDVCNEIGLTGSNRTLSNCFGSAIDSGFDNAHRGSKDRLLNFRNYQHSISTSSLLLVDEKSASNACARWSDTPTSRIVRYIPSGQSFNNATALYSNSNGTTLAPADWYSNGVVARAWNGSTFTFTQPC
ncbi:hypothetical protein [Costertonia aggregata]|uniref:Uncharacterized protein n=1 Tax=Costertonia aggregata TaxID=343403 RepID=A0A7H9ARE1_9FLAO|nr:hypothetical protein [Costertonia aggregata]QLG46061.1 hypothetical protein HYG79_12130 [Costertonia aggregata]